MLLYKGVLFVVIMQLFDVPLRRYKLFYFLELPVLSQEG